MNIVFPENTGRVPQPRQLKFVHVLAIAYACGGVAALLAVLSKFVVTPLFDQLTADRRVYAREGRIRLQNLNLLLEKCVSKVPVTDAIEEGYVDAGVQTDRSTAPKKIQQDLSQIQTFERDIKLAMPIPYEEKTLASEVTSFEKYLRELQYPHLRRPGSIISGDRAESDSMSKLRQEIRSFKGVLLGL